MHNTPSPFMGEGWGEGEYTVISRTYVPLPLIPSHQGRGNSTFYETIKLETGNWKLEIRYQTLYSLLNHCYLRLIDAHQMPTKFHIMFLGSFPL